MGVSKQAVQKRFVPRWDGSDPIPTGELGSRFTVRGRRVVAAAGQLGAAFGLPVSAATADADLRDLHFTDGGKAAMEGTLEAALRLGHDYIGTEHILWGCCTPMTTPRTDWPNSGSSSSESSRASPRRSPGSRPNA